MTTMRFAHASRRSRLLAHWARLTSTLMLSLAVASCSESPWEPGPIERVQITPPIVSDILLGGGMLDNSAISFNALAASDTYSMPDASYYPLYVWSTSGDTETVRAHSSACYDNADRVYVCDAFQVRIDAASDPAAALAAATAADALVLRSDWWPDSAVFHSFDNLAAAMRAVRGRPGVQRVGLWYLDSIGIDPAGFRRYATATLRLEHGSTPTANDGRLTAMPGDSVYARVFQPGGHVTRGFLLW